MNWIRDDYSPYPWHAIAETHPNGWRLTKCGMQMKERPGNVTKTESAQRRPGITCGSCFHVLERAKKATAQSERPAGVRA